MPARTARSSRRAAPVAPSAFAPQRSAASAKELVIFEIERARVAVRAAIQGMSSAAANRPVAPGKWSPREIVLHLSVSDRLVIQEFDAILRGAPALWAHLDEAAVARDNAEHLAPLRGTSWDDAVRLMERTREDLLAALLAVPVKPAEAWGETHPFGATMRELARHDRHHAKQIKNARIAG